MDLTENHIKWISHFTEAQFDNIVDKYLEEVYKIDNSVKTDGPWDGGNDIRIFVNAEKLKVAFQVTIQEKNIEKKINDDLAKTKENVDKYNYQKVLFFFYSQPVSEEKMNEYELFAETRFNIKLYLIDAKRIAYTAKHFPNLLREINKQYGFKYDDKPILNEVDRMLYDFYSFGSSAAEIKDQIIKSFIVHNIYSTGAINRADLINNLVEHFKSKENVLFNRIINQLGQEERLTVNHDVIKLTEKEQNRVDVLKEQFNFQEHQFQNDIKEFLKKFTIAETHVASIINKLKELFESSFNADKLDVLDKIGEIDHDPLSDALTSFYLFLKSISNENKARYLIRELIETCKKNDIIQKLSAGKIFTSFIDPEVIRNYLNQTERLVFLDTPIVLYSLCLYSNDVKHTNYYYNSVKDLFGIRDENKNLKFLFYRNYISEVAFHFKEALLLTDFDEADLIDSFGGSNNVFYNFYVYLRDHHHLEDNINSFSDYLSESFGITSGDILTSYFQEKLNMQVKECLGALKVDIFENYVAQELVGISIETFEECLKDKERTRTYDTIKNDSYMLSSLVDDKISVNEPIFVTWDLIFLNARKKYHQKIPASRLWHWFTPDRLNNHLSLLNFKLDSETITRDILTVIDDKFKFYKKTQSLLDTVSKLINIKTSTGRKYINAIKEFKRDYIYEIPVKPQFEYKAIEEKKVYPIEEVMFSLVKHYYQNKVGYNLEDFKSIFQTETVYEDVMNYFKEELNFYMENKKLSEKATISMNVIIKKLKEPEANVAGS